MRKSAGLPLLRVDSAVEPSSSFKVKCTSTALLLCTDLDMQVAHLFCPAAAPPGEFVTPVSSQPRSVKAFQHNQRRADTDSGIGEVEGGEVPVPDVEIDHIDDKTMPQPVE